MEQIGLFGGSFDPVHHGHLLIARAAFEELGLDRLVFIPAAQSPFKPETPPAPAEARVRWLRLALAGWRGVEVDTSELERGGVSYTINTIRHHRSRCPAARLFWLIGADHVALLPTWREADELAQLVEFAVVPRPGEPLPVAPAIFRVHALRGCLSGVSSSLVRGRVAAGLPIDLLVPANVAEAVHNSGLYLRNALTDDPSDGFAQAGSALPPTR